MESPVFKKVKGFDGGFYKVPCLLGKIKHSSVPQVAKKVSKDFFEDEQFEVALIGEANLSTPDDWHQLMLRRLFEQEELVGGIQTGIDDMASSPDFEFDPDAAKEIKRSGFLPWVYVRVVIIDSLEKVVFVTLNNEIDSNLQEHGLAVYCKEDKWKWGDGDNFERQFFTRLDRRQKM